VATEIRAQSETFLRCLLRNGVLAKHEASVGRPAQSLLWALIAFAVGFAPLAAPSSFSLARRAISVSRVAISAYSWADAVIRTLSVGMTSAGRSHFGSSTQP